MSSPLRLKAYGLSDIDYSSLKSMLSLAKSLLDSPWQLITEGEADLTIYSLESDYGRNAWQQHSTGLSCILTSDLAIKTNADGILKKPLRTKNFSEVLNKIQSKKQFADQADKVAKLNQKKPSQAQQDKPEKQKSSFFSSLTKKLSSTKGPVEELPSLKLDTPDINNAKANTILDTQLLKQWLDALPENDNDKITTAILGHLVQLNRSKVNVETRLALLDIYKTPIEKLVFERDLQAINKETHAPAEFLRSVNNLAELLEELAIGYKIIVQQQYQKGLNPAKTDIYLTAIIRTGEFLSLAIVHAYRYYREAPVNSLHELHQLYHYCEASNTSEKTISSKSLNAPLSFHHYYCQIILTGISDPYGLPKYEVFRLFKLMKSMADKVIIRPLSENQKLSAAGFLARGSFCLDLSSDRLPAAINKTPDAIRIASLTRNFSTEVVLENIEKIFQKYSKTNLGGYDLDFKLLKKIIPQINSSYERLYQRNPVTENCSAQLSYGIDNSYQALILPEQADHSEWQILNRTNHGMMVSTDGDSNRQLNIEEVVAVFEADKPCQLAIIRWMYRDNNDTSLLGLETYKETAQAVSFTADGDTKILYGLLLPEDEKTKRPVTVFAETGVYSKNRVLRMKHSDNTFVIQLDDLVVDGFNFEQFNYTVIKK